MINKPSVEELSDKADSVYTLVILASQRARQINAGGEHFLKKEEKPEIEKPVSLGLKEIQYSKVKYQKNTEETIK